MRKLSETIHLAVASPLYMSGLMRYDFLCNVLEELFGEGSITQDECCEARVFISVTLLRISNNRHITSLRSALRQIHPEFESERSISFNDKRMMHCCRMFWAVLCMDLVRKGL